MKPTHRAVMIALTVVSALAGRAPAQQPDLRIRDGIWRAFDRGNIGQLGHSWRVPDAPPTGEDGTAAVNRWDLPFPKSFPSNQVSLGQIYSGLAKSQDGTKLIYPELGTLQKDEFHYSDKDKEVATAGFNVRRILNQSARSFDYIASFGAKYNLAQAKDRPAILAQFRSADGISLHAIPDQTVINAATRLAAVARGKGGNQLLTNLRQNNDQDASDAKLLCKYLATNQELSIYRSLVTDPLVQNQLKKLAPLVTKRDTQGGSFNYDLTDPAIRREVSNLMAVLDIAPLKGLGTNSFPTLDEVRGIYHWSQYFAARENAAGVTAVVNGKQVSFFGESAVGGFLDSKATQNAADLVRFGGTNPRPLPMTPDEIRDESKRGYEERDGRQHDWIDAAVSVLKPVRDGKDEDVKRPNREGRPENDGPRKK